MAAKKSSKKVKKIAKKVAGKEVAKKKTKKKTVFKLANAQQVVDEARIEVDKELPKMPKVPKSTLKPKKLRTEKDIAMDFASEVQKKFDRLVKASVLFGSQTHDQSSANSSSDIDIILIVDDALLEWDMELVSWYREELGKIISSKEHYNNLHVNTVKLTTWWEDMLHGDPVVINILRYGEGLIDYGGFFNPLKSLLIKGKVRSTPEAVHAALQRAPRHLARSKLSEVGAIEGSYWAMVDSAQAALMTAGKMPPSPSHVPDMLHSTFVEAGMLKAPFVKGFKELYALHKTIEYGNISDMKGAEIDEWQDLSQKFVVEMIRIVDSLLDQQLVNSEK